MPFAEQLLWLLLDVLTGSSLIRLSPLGYDVMLGARFYGIGNEYMGILVGSSLLAALSIRDRQTRFGGLSLANNSDICSGLQDWELMPVVRSR